MIAAGLRRVLAAVAAAFVSLAVAAGGPPPTRADAVVDTYFGTPVEDPYRWLESLGSADVQAWFVAQNAWTRSVLDALPGRPALRARIAELNAADTRVRDAQFGGDDLFYLKRAPADSQYKLYARRGIDGPERLLVDPDRFRDGDEPAAIDYFRASPNGRRLAFGVSTGGSENTTMHVVDVATGSPIGPPVPRARNGAPAWRFDSNVLFYHQLKELPPDAPPSELLRDSRAYTRTIAADGETTDAPVFGRGLSKALALDPDDSPFVFVSPVSPYAIAVVTHGVDREVTLYVAPLTEVRGTATPWRRLAGRERGIVDVELRGEWIYLIANENAPRYRVVRWSLKDGRPYDPATAEVVVEETERIVTGFGVAKDALYVQQMDAGYGRLLRLEFNVKLRGASSTRSAPPANGSTARGARSATAQGRSAPPPRGTRDAGSSPTRRGATSSAGTRTPRNARGTAKPAAPASLPKVAGVARGTAIPLPYPGAIQERVTDPLRPGALLRLAGWTESPAYYAVDGKTGALARTSLMPPSTVAFRDVGVTEVRVRSHDGVEVPLTIVHPRRAPRDGSAPLLIEAYGAYGEPMEPAFWPTLAAWLERGGIYAVAHVRGGGELGKAWHLAGRQATKANTWKDLIACGEWLVRERWTRPERLAAMGASAGGITVGNAMIDKPALFAAIVSIVGFNDALRSEAGTAGPANATEFGSVATEQGFRALAAMSVYARLDARARYPSVLFTTGFNDSRVDAWDPGKTAARLQAINGATGGSGEPVLLRVDFAAGHGLGATREQTIEEYTDVFAFLRWRLGDPAFAPPPPPVPAPPPALAPPAPPAPEPQGIDPRREPA